MLLDFAYPRIAQCPHFKGNRRLGGWTIVRWTPWNHLCSSSSFLTTFPTLLKIHTVPARLFILDHLKIVRTQSEWLQYSIT